MVAAIARVIRKAREQARKERSNRRLRGAKRQAATTKEEEANGHPDRHVEAIRDVRVNAAAQYSEKAQAAQVARAGHD